MQVTETLSEGLKRAFTISIDAKDMNEKLDARLEQLGESVKIPGFRPGKVPMSVLRQRFADNVRGEVLENSVQDSSSQALQERGLQPAVQPKVEITKYDEKEGLEYTMEFEIMPEIAPMDFAKLELERVTVEVPDSEVDETLQRVVSQQKNTKPLEADRPAQSGDVLVIDFKGTVGGEAFPGMEGEGHHLELGSNSFVAGFEDQLVGASKGDERDVTVTFPEEYANDKLSGKEAVFKVKVNDILETEPMEISDETAKTFGEESVEAMKARIRNRISEDYDGITRSRLKRELLDKLAEGHDFEVPEGMVEVEFEQIWKQIEQDMQNDNLDPEDKGKSEEELKAEYREIAIRRVRLGLLLSEVGRRNEIDVTQEELNNALMAEAQRYPGQERQVIEFFQKNPQAVANLRAPIYEDKVIDFIVGLAKVTDKTMSLEELQAEFESENAAPAEEEAPKEKKSGGKKAKAKED